jgi:hypothetical protein
MNLSPVITKHYGNFHLLGRRKNKPNSNPIKPNFLETQMNINPVMTKHYGNFHLLGHRKNKPNSNPIKPNFCPNRP